MHIFRDNHKLYMKQLILSKPLMTYFNEKKKEFQELTLFFFILCSLSAGVLSSFYIMWRFIWESSDNVTNDYTCAISILFLLPTSIVISLIRCTFWYLLSECLKIVILDKYKSLYPVRLTYSVLYINFRNLTIIVQIWDLYFWRREYINNNDTTRIMFWKLFMSAWNNFKHVVTHTLDNHQL